MLNAAKITQVLHDDFGYREGETILVGVSGGADSTALLHVLHAAGISIAAAHVNYGLRGIESDAEEQFVSGLCASLGIPLYLRKTNEEELAALSNNLQESARIFRYALFSEILEKESLSWIATAHTSDDQLETVLMNLMRGSGLRGMQGIAMKQEKVIRPLLLFSRGEIENYLVANDQQWCTDSSNETDAYLRNRVRHHLVPAVKELDERNGAGWQSTIRQLKATGELLDELMEAWISRVSNADTDAVYYNFEKLNEFPQPHLLLNYVLHKRGVNIQFSPEEYETLLTQQPGKKYYDGKTELLVDRGQLILAYMQKPAGEFVLMSDTQPADWSCSFIDDVDPKKYTGYEAVIGHISRTSVLSVRPWKEGDRIYPLGFNGSRKVSDVLTEMKIPLHEKRNFPVVVCSDEIVWIPGYRIAEKFRVTEKTKTAVHIKWNR
ncbi:MAG TPA: tRNA lysidine(34) synthetase TilS [Bacteroidia bacterium]|nr:tRNA lysidine(34) synthetase TilS [Bacteroidia bacterium]